jgi:hypothetical protein
MWYVGVVNRVNLTKGVKMDYIEYYRAEIEAEEKAQAQYRAREAELEGILIDGLTVTEDDIEEVMGRDSEVMGLTEEEIRYKMASYNGYGYLKGMI